MVTAGKIDVAVPSASQLYEIETPELLRTKAKDCLEHVYSELIGIKLVDKANDILKPLSKSSLLELCEDHCVGEFHLVEECKEQHCLIAKEIFQLMTSLCKKCSEIDPRFETSLVWTGSSAEGTKMWLPNEFDFLLELVQLRGNCEYDNRFELSSRPISLTKQECQKLWSDLCFKDTCRLSSLGLKNHFVTLMHKAAFLLDKNGYQNIHWPENAIEETKVGVNITVHWCGDKYKDMRIGIDLTPGIPVHLSEEQLSRYRAHSVRKLISNFIHVIPLTKYGGVWRPSFSLSEFQMIKNLTRKQIALYKCLKFFRDIHISWLFSKTKVPSYYLKTFFFNYLFRDHDGPDVDTEDEDYYCSFCRFLHRLILASSRPNGDNVIAHFFCSSCILVLDRYEMLWVKSTLRLLEKC